MQSKMLMKIIVIAAVVAVAAAVVKPSSMYNFLKNIFSCLKPLTVIGCKSIIQFEFEFKF